MAAGNDRRGILLARLLRITALLGIFAIFTITAAAVTLHVLHDTDASHNCAFCHLSKVQALNPYGWCHISVPEVLVTFVGIEDISQESSTILARRMPRAPPA